MTAIEISSQ